MKQVKFFALALFCALLQTTAFSQSQNAGKIVTDYFAWVDAGNLDAVGTLLADDFSATAPFSPVPFNKMAWRGVGQGFNAAFPDMKHDIVDWFANGNKVAVKGVFRGTNTGPNMGNPATGNKVNCAFNTILDLDGMGKIKSINIQFDMKAFEAQLMAGLPDPGASAEATVRGVLLAADAGDVEKMVSYFTPDCTHYFSGQAANIEELKKRVMGFKMGFPDVKRDLEVVYANAGLIVLKGWLTGTNTGSFMGKPATGNKVRASVLGFYKLNPDGKVTEACVEMDFATLLNQLKGAVAGNGK